MKEIIIEPHIGIGQLKLGMTSDELENALSNKIIDANTYNKAIKTKDKLLKEIKNNCNKYLSMDMKELLNEI